MLLYMIIFVPKQIETDINFYLSPLNEYLRHFLGEGVDDDVDNVYSGEKFEIHAMLYFIINNFLAYYNLNGYNVNGHKYFPICESNTNFHQLQFGKKTIYLGH